MEAAGFCGMEVATRGLVGGSGSSSPPELDSPGSQEHLGMFELVSSCCSEEVRGETPGREDCPLDPNNAELDPGGGGGKIKDQKGLGKEVLLLMQALTTLASPEEKLAALCKKYADSLEESRSIQKQVKALQKKQSQMVKEKIHLQSEHSKAILARSKLESLCRELQRHNKTLKDDNTQRSREYEERRKEATLHFQMTLNQIEVQMEQHNSHNSKLRQENMELAQKLNKLIKQYELREEHIDKVFKHKEKQQQLVDAKLQRTAELMRELEGKQQRERDFVSPTGLLWLSLYMDKFEEFQTTLAKSNEVFTTFRQEMEKMTKKIKKLEKETTLWRTKWETNNQALLQMAEEKTLRDKHHKGLHGKLECLEKLCRALQKERDDLTTKLGDLQSTTEEGTEPLDPQPSQESTQDEMSPPGSGEETQSLTTPELELESSTTEQLDN
ncbi:gamma-taxilin [Oncorhynchus tshawytscha]|uniref:gamma-taxilin n=1 Tax=Oncorhynchus tshawytscha TaxID=74940 RepID=UPI001C3C5302|nr:gamma-taxilin [Oncorhynchus tshawytscha]